MRSRDIRTMFDSIVPTYDLLNRVLSLGRDAYWRRVLAEAVRPEGESLVVDVATGTADVALAICRRHPGARVVGVDFSRPMLDKGRRKAEERGFERRVSFTQGDARFLPLEEMRYDVVTVAFGIRNMEERGEALQEFRRVLKPGGQLLILEFGLPDDAVIRGLYRVYFDHLLPWLGSLVSRNGRAYRHLSDSVHDFPTEEEFLREINGAGFARATRTRLSRGLVNLFRGYRD